MSYKSVPQECSRRVPKSVPQRLLQECSARVPHKSVLQDPQECPTRVSYKSVSKERHKSVPQECPTRVFCNRVLQECSARASHKSECHTRCPTRVHKSVPQRCPKRMCPTRVSHKSVAYKGFNNLFRSLFSSACLHSGSWVPSCFPQFPHTSPTLEAPEASVGLPLISARIGALPCWACLSRSRSTTATERH